MQFLYRLQPARSAMLRDGATESEALAVSRHFAHLQALVAQGVVILAGRTLTADEETFGLVVFNAETEEDAREMMLEDPAVREGVMSARLFPYRIALISEANATG